MSFAQNFRNPKLFNNPIENDKNNHHVSDLQSSLSYHPNAETETQVNYQYNVLYNKVPELLNTDKASTFMKSAIVSSRGSSRNLHNRTSSMTVPSNIDLKGAALSDFRKSGESFFGGNDLRSITSGERTKRGVSSQDNRPHTSQRSVKFVFDPPQTPINN